MARVDDHELRCSCSACAGIASDANAAAPGDPSGPAPVSGGAPDIDETTDAAANTATAYTLTVGQTAQGQLSTGADHDLYGINLVAGQTYTFALTGTGTNNVLDTYLRLYSSNGTTLLAQNDDGLPGSNSILTFTASTTGTFYLDAGSFNNAYAGQYGLSATLGSRASLDLRMGAGVIDTDLSWNATPGTGATITYGFRQTTNGDAPNFSQLTAVQIVAVQTALQFWSDVAGINFVQVNAGGYTDNATILFADYFSTSDGAGAYAYFPGSTAAIGVAGDVWLNTASVSTTSLPFGGYSFHAILHEIGHALGLSHPGLYNAAPGQTITYANNAQFTQDTSQYSVMSYFDESNTGANHGGYAETPMILDVFALQRIYGANASTRVGDTVYGFGSNAGVVFDFAQNSTPAICIWDAGGSDTLNCSGFNQAQTISLADGTFSDIGGLAANVSIALGTTIENAVGGSGNDKIFLASGNTNNLINGSAGSDTAYVTYVYQGGYTVLGTATNLTMSGGAGTDTFQNVEFFVFLGGMQVSAATLIADAPPTAPDLTAGNVGRSDATPEANQVITVTFQISNIGTRTTDGSFMAGVYLSTDATIDAGDTLLGEQSVAALAGNSSSNHSLNVALPGGLVAGVTYYIGVIADDTNSISEEISESNNASAGVAVTISEPPLFDNSANTVTLTQVGRIWHALGGNDVVTGTGGVDVIYGDDGNDTIEGGAGADQLFGGLGIDTVSYANSSVGVAVNISLKSTVAQSSDGNAAGDKLDTFENITGSEHDDTLTGSQSANVLLGLGGNDRLIGGAGADTLTGGLGNDIYVVDNVGDEVREQAGEGTDTIQSSVSIAALADQVENLVLAGTANLNATGNALDNSITGNGGRNILDGGGGHDTLIGGAGNDTYRVDDSNDVITELNGGGTDLVQTTASSFSLAAIDNVENLTYSGSGAFNGTGNSLANTITGGNGNDWLDGGAGADTLVGGLGDDTYVLDVARDVVRENSGAGIDTILSTLSSYTLGANLENLIFIGNGDFRGTGNGLANSITGGNGNDTLNGAGGDDRILGGAGNDRLSGGAGNDLFVLASGSGNDTITDFDANPTGGQDLLDISGYGISAVDFAARVTVVDLGNDTRVTIDGVDTVLLVGVNGTGSNIITQQHFLLL